MHKTKPFLNLDEIKDFKETTRGPFQARWAHVSSQIGAKKLGYSVTIVPPGKKMCPFHSHRVNEEMFLILEGEGILRFGKDEYQIKKHDIIACPPGGTEVAHQIVNTSNSDIKYLSLSTEEPVEICEYPDSDKIMTYYGEWGSRDFSHISKRSQAVDYMEGEDH